MTVHLTSIKNLLDQSVENIGKVLMYSNKYLEKLELNDIGISIYADDKYLYKFCNNNIGAQILLNESKFKSEYFLDVVYYSPVCLVLEKPSDFLSPEEINSKLRANYNKASIYEFCVKNEELISILKNYDLDLNVLIHEANITFKDGNIKFVSFGHTQDVEAEIEEAFLAGD